MRSRSTDRTAEKRFRKWKFCQGLGVIFKQDRTVPLRPLQTKRITMLRSSARHYIREESVMAWLGHLGEQSFPRNYESPRIERGPPCDQINWRGSVELTGESLCRPSSIIDWSKVFCCGNNLLGLLKISNQSWHHAHLNWSHWLKSTPLVSSAILDPPDRVVTLKWSVVSTLRYLPISTIEPRPWIVVSVCLAGPPGSTPQMPLKPRWVICDFTWVKNGLSEVVQLHIRPILISITLDQSQS